MLPVTPESVTRFIVTTYRCCFLIDLFWIDWRSHQHHHRFFVHPQQVLWYTMAYDTLVHLCSNVVPSLWVESFDDAAKWFNFLSDIG
jgi:hypothetical protein